VAAPSASTSAAFDTSSRNGSTFAPSDSISAAAVASAFLLHVGHHDVHALARGDARRFEAEAGARAGDHGRAAFESFHEGRISNGTIQAGTCFLTW